MTQQAVNADGATTDASELRRVVAASVAGTALEWYDFFIYGFAVTLVFNELSSGTRRRQHPRGAARQEPHAHHRMKRLGALWTT